MIRTTIVSAALLAAVAPLAHTWAAVEIEVSSKVIVPAEHYEPLGVNYFGDAGGQRHSGGNLIWNPGFEPITMRDLYRVIDAGQDKGKYWAQLDGPGTSAHILYTTGTYSGESMRAYRFVDGKSRPLPYKKADWAETGELLDTQDVDHVQPLFKTTVVAKGEDGFPGGGWIADVPFDSYSGWSSMSKEEQLELKKTWRVYYEGGQELRKDDLVIFERTMIWPDKQDFHVRTNGEIDFYWSVPTGEAKQVAIPEDAPAEMNGGKGVLEVTPNRNGVVELWNKQFGATGREDSFYYGVMDVGELYVYELWAKVDGKGKARLTLGFGDNRAGAIDRGYFGQPLGESFVIDNQWKKYRFTFRGLPTPVEGGVEGACIRVESDQPVLIDNVKLQLIYSEDNIDKDFVIYKPLFDELMSSQPETGRKGAVRLWAGLTEGSMEGLLDMVPDNKLSVGSAIRINAHHLTTLPKSLMILEATGDSPETRMVPWIILQIMHNEEEHRQLVEYLAAPYDPAVDTPESKPMAYKRVQQRGHNRPWTDDFRELIVEFGNENWHNRGHTGWIGVGRYSHIMGAGFEYGAWHKYMGQEMQKSPYWNNKMSLCVGGNYTGYVDGNGQPRGYGYEATLKAGRFADYHTHATYIGPRWETGEKSQTSIDDEGVQRTLLSYRPVKQGEWSGHQEAQARLRELGFRTKISGYEGGPSGFGYRAKSKEEELAGEYYGKSVAMATAMLDAWIDAWQMGWTYQCYLGFQQGKWWSSHTSIANGFRPSPGFLAETMINRTMANHDLLAVSVQGSIELDTTSAVRERDRDKFPSTVPSIAAHAAGDRDRIAVSLSNLSLDEDQAVEIKLPLRRVRQVLLHRMTGGPRDTNMDAENVTLETVELDASQFKRGVFPYTVAAGKAVILEFRDQPAGDDMATSSAEPH